MRYFIYALFLLCLFPRITLSAEYLGSETDFRFGVGVFNSAKDSRAEIKSISLGHSEDLMFGLRHKYELIGWIDSRSDIGRKTGAMAVYSLGVDVNPGDFFAQFYMGAGLKLPNDSYLGGPFQFKEEVTFGIRDKQLKSIGIGYSHISSAGIFKPNVGRDFIQLKVGIPF